MNPNSIQAEMISLFQKTAEYAKNFKKTTYEQDMDTLVQENKTLLERIQQEIESSDEAMEEIALFIPTYVKEQLELLPSKRKKEIVCLDYNMNMVSYFVPLMGEIISIKTKPFTEKIIHNWNETLPGNKIGHSTRAQIQSGFRKGLLCYITTAVCQNLNKDDNCYELELLRNYRDKYLLCSEDGSAIVQEYYNIAPTIVKRIDSTSNAKEIYEQIWQDYLSPCVMLIESNQKEACQELYYNMVRKLEKNIYTRRRN